MPYITKDQYGHIITVAEIQQYEGQEFVESAELWQPGLSYADLRRAEYPPVTDYLDGIVKGDQAQIQKYIDDCLEVKKKYPK